MTIEIARKITFGQAVNKQPWGEGVNIAQKSRIASKKPKANVDEA